jgi:hypothetical protein
VVIFVFVEVVRLRGVARRIGDGEGPLAGSCELGVRRKRQRHVVDGQFELVESSGATSVIEVAGAAVIGQPERRASYKDIANEPGVAAIGIRAEPDAEVTLTSAWILDGKPIEVIGNRDDKLVHAIAAGSRDAIDAWEAREKSKPPAPPAAPSLPWNIIVPILLVFVTIIFAEASVLLGSSHAAFIAPTIAITTAAAAVGLLWEQIRLPKFDEREQRRTKLFFALAIVLGIAINLPPEGPIGVTVQGGLVLGVGIFGLIRERRIVSLAKRLVGTPGDPQEGKPGVFVGAVKDDTPDQFFSQMIAVGAIHTIKKQQGKRKPTIESERKGFDSTFQLKLARPDGEMIEIDPADATWSSELRNKRETWSVFLPVDAALVVAGTPERRDGRWFLRTTAPDSLVFYGVPGGTDPQAPLRRNLMLHKVTYGALFMVVALAAALAWNGFRLS